MPSTSLQPHDAQTRYIITGGPGVGKTTIINHLKSLGENAIYEAATDIIRQEQAKGNLAPWTNPSFEENIIDLQEKRQMEAAAAKTKRVFFDRSPIDTLTYRLMSEHKVTKKIKNAVVDILKNRFYNKTVFLIEHLHFYKKDEIRHETAEEALKIQNKLKEIYTKLGFRVVLIPSAPVEARVQRIMSTL